MRCMPALTLAALLIGTAAPVAGQTSLSAEELLGRPGQAPPPAAASPLVTTQERGGDGVYPYGRLEGRTIGGNGLSDAFGQRAWDLPIPWAPIGGILETASPAPTGSGLPLGGAAGTARVIGGTAVPEGERPWQVQLRIDVSESSYATCGGSVIDPNWVLTAAHCVVQEGRVVPARMLTVFHGSTRFNAGERVRVAAVIAHEGYREGMDAASRAAFPNDIALLRLAEPVRRQPVALMTPQEEAEIARAGTSIEQATVSGWGRTTDGGRTSDRMMKADLTVFHIDTCTRSFWPQGVWNRQICSGTASGERSSCQGDSGGPLVATDPSGRPVQIGIVSFGRQKCEMANAPGVFTRVASYLDWITKTVRADGSGGGGSGGGAGNGQGAPRVALGIAQGRSVKLGSPVQFQVASERTGYLLLIDINAAAEVALVYPNEFSEPAQDRPDIRAGGTVRVPEASTGFDIRASEPAGPGLLFAVVSDQQLDTKRTVDSARSMARGFVAQASSGGGGGPGTADALRKTAEQLIHDLQELFGPEGQAWSGTYLPYEIVR